MAARLFKNNRVEYLDVPKTPGTGKPYLKMTDADKGVYLGKRVFEGALPPSATRESGAGGSKPTMGILSFKLTRG